MTAIINWLKRWLGPVPSAVTDEHCPYCHGLGYDSSGWTCTCLREKKMSKTLDMARASHLDLYGLGKGHMDFLDALRRFEALVRADERGSKPHSLDPGEMELSLKREHNGELFECRRRFSAKEVILGPDFLVEATAKILDVQMDRAIRVRGST